MAEKIRIGGASGFWGESMMATPQLLAEGGVDYIVYDFLAEITMSIMARARLANPEMGYAGDFISGVLAPHAKQIADKGVKILSNAGGVNPLACGAAARAVIAEQGLDLKVAVVTGDDLMPRAKEFADLREMFSDAQFPPVEKLASMNAYLGAFPIARALAEGADIVITGRSVDSAVSLGACIHAFGWTADQHDQLAQGSLAGHIIECGPQATGGNFTDWAAVADGLATIGYPIVEVARDGDFIVTKPKDTGGQVSVGTVAEQMLYEIGDPQAYMLPDVVCDFSAVAIEQIGTNAVRVSGAKGYAAPDAYKVSATWFDGFRAGSLLSFVGFDAEAKARAFADAVFARCRTIFHNANMPDFEETSVELLGAESQYGAARQSPPTRELVLKLAAKHTDAKGAGALLKEMTGLALATPAGLSIFAGARPKPSPVVRLFSCQVPKSALSIGVEVEGKAYDFTEAEGVAFDAMQLTRPAPPPASDAERVTTVPLIALAWGRSGDKGDKANIGIIARHADYMPYIWDALDEATIANRFAHFLEGGAEAVRRYYMPGAPAINFVLDNVLGGGGVASLRNDPQGKAYAQILLDHPIPVSQQIADAV